MSLYVLDNIEVRAGGFRLTSKRCELEEGRVYSVVGASGAGKSTFLNILGFMAKPSAGSVSFRGKDAAGRADIVSLRREVAYLMQNPYLFSSTVEENIAYGLKVRGVSRKEAQARVRNIMSRLYISSLTGRRTRDLSGGEAQRVALARTLVLDAKAVLLDEPSAGIDMHNLRIVEKAVLALCRERNATLVLSTHSIEQAYRMSSNIISIVNGRVHGAVYENVFEGRVTARKDGACDVDVGVTLRVSGTPEEDAVTIALESEDIVLSGERLASSALNSLHGTISRIDGSAAGLRVFVSAGVDVCAAVTRESFERMKLCVGSQVWLSFKASSVKIL